MKRILVVAAHPDDEVLGMGGTIAKLTAQNHEVHLLIVTDGSTSQYRGADNLSEIIENKRKETEECVKLLGIKTVLYGMLPDMKLDVTSHVDVNKVIEDAVEKLKPDTVFTHFWGDVNLDHQCVYRSTLVAVRPVFTQCVREVYCYNTPSSTEWSPSVPNAAYMPDFYVDITDYAELKYKAFKAYKTEVRDFPHPRSVEYLRKTDETTGLSVGLNTAEAFITLRRFG